MKKSFRITINGKSFDVQAETLDDNKPRRSTSSGSVQATATAPSPSKPAPSSSSENAGEGSVPSPLAGKVVSVDVAVGKAVNAGDQIMTLEAMKMNTIVSAPFAGTVSSIDVNAGDSVEEGQSLMTLA